MNKEHHFSVTVTWTGNKGPGTSSYNAYDRSNSVTVAGKPELLCSSDAAFNGDRSKYSPEDLLIASISECHMLWYLHLCAEAGVIVTAYSDTVKGKMVV